MFHYIPRYYNHGWNWTYWTLRHNKCPALGLGVIFIGPLEYEYWLKETKIDR